MAKENAHPKTAPQEDPVSQLGAIQNIIIGPAMAEFSKRLAELETSMDTKNVEVHTIIQETKDTDIADLRSDLADLRASLNALTKRFESFEETVNRELSRLEGHKANWADLGDMLMKLGESVKNSKK